MQRGRDRQTAQLVGRNAALEVISGFWNHPPSADEELDRTTRTTRFSCCTESFGRTGLASVSHPCSRSCWSVAGEPPPEGRADTPGSRHVVACQRLLPIWPERYLPGQREMRAASCEALELYREQDSDEDVD